MPLSLNLPYAVCYLATRFVRRLRPSGEAARNQSQADYFEWQYRDTLSRDPSHMNWPPFENTTVLDIGGGLGGRSLGWLDLGAAKVINVDINRQELAVGRAILLDKHPIRAKQVEFRHPDENAEPVVADIAILFDCFEHLVDPLSVLKQLHSWLRPGGLVWIGSFGWYAYLASHLLGVIPIPWCQVLFSEKAIIRTIRTLLHSPNYKPCVWEEIEGLDRWDTVATLRDRPGEPLNMLSLRKIRQVLRQSPFELTRFRIHGFSGKANPLARVAAPLAHVPILQELTHSYYTALLTKSESKE